MYIYLLVLYREFVNFLGYVYLKDGKLVSLK